MVAFGEEPAGFIGRRPKPVDKMYLARPDDPVLRRRLLFFVALLLGELALDRAEGRGGLGLGGFGSACDAASDLGGSLAGSAGNGWV